MCSPSQIHRPSSGPITSASSRPGAWQPPMKNPDRKAWLLGGDALHEGVRKFARSGKTAAREWNEFSRHIRYLQGDFKSHATYKELSNQCANLEKEWGSKAQRIFYMADRK